VCILIFYFLFACIAWDAIMNEYDSWSYERRQIEKPGFVHATMSPIYSRKAIRAGISFMSYCLTQKELLNPSAQSKETLDNANPLVKTEIKKLFLETNGQRSICSSTLLGKKKFTLSQLRHIFDTMAEYGMGKHEMRKTPKNGKFVSWFHLEPFHMLPFECQYVLIKDLRIPRAVYEARFPGT
jgi:hypothetical protein